MDQNPTKTSRNKNPSRPTVLSQSRSVSTISSHQNKISFMPKFLLKTLQRKKHNHKRSSSINSTMNANSNHNDLSSGNEYIKQREKIARIGKHVLRYKRYLMQFIPTPRRVRSIVSSVVLRSNKSCDQERFKDRRPGFAKQGSKGCNSTNDKSSKNIESTYSSSSSPSLLSSLASDYNEPGLQSIKGQLGKDKLPCNAANNSESYVKVDDVVTPGTNKGGRVSGEKCARKKGLMETKGGLKIKGITVKIKGITVKIKGRQKGDKRFELCKKKILMGEKCRPLHGTLRYDKNGILVPENLRGSRENLW